MVNSAVRRKALAPWTVETKDGTSEEQKTQIKVSRGWHAEVMKAAGSGEALDTTAAGWNVQVADFGALDSSKHFKAAVADIGVSEHQTRKETWIIPGAEPRKCHTEIRRTRSSVSGNLEKSHRVDNRFGSDSRASKDRRVGERVVSEKIRLEKDTKVYLMSEGRKIGWRELERIEEDKLVNITQVMNGEMR